MKKITLLVLVALSGVTSIARGQHRSYFSDQVFTPGLYKAKQLKIGLSAIPQLYTPDMKYNDFFKTTFCAAVQAAYAPTDHLGVFASFRTRGKKQPEKFLNTDFEGMNYINYKSGYYRGNSAEIALGYFTRMGKHAMVETYAGYSYGSLGSHDFLRYENGDSSDYNFKTNYHRFFIQGATGVQNEYFSFRAGLRIIVQRYNNFAAADSSIDIFQDHHSVYAGSSYSDQGAGITNQTFGFVEPFVNLEAGGKIVKFNFQGGFSSQIGGDRIHRNANVDPYASIGVNVLLATTN